MYTRFYNQLGKPPDVNLFFPSLACALKLVISCTSWLLFHISFFFPPRDNTVVDNNRVERILQCAEPSGWDTGTPASKHPATGRGLPHRVGLGTAQGPRGHGGHPGPEPCPVGMGHPSPTHLGTWGHIALCVSTAWGAGGGGAVTDRHWGICSWASALCR